MTNTTTPATDGAQTPRQTRQQTPREIVTRALTFQQPARIPQQIWYLPWVDYNYPAEAAALRERYPSDIGGPPGPYHRSTKTAGDPHRIGTFIDEWGCEFENLADGIIGEVKRPLLGNLEDAAAYQAPYEVLPEAHEWQAGTDRANRACAESDLFMMASTCPRPWERFQFLRGSENAYMDMYDPSAEALALLRKIHDFYMKDLEFWVRTDVDAVNFMDDWGAQHSLLISPEIWRAVFKPLYKDYCDLAKAHNKFVFMHSDGHTAAIYPDLIEVGVTALNSQLFTMDIEELGRRFGGKITFWGEIDRQHVLAQDDPEVVREAVRRVAKALYRPQGGVFAQFELGAGARIEHATVIMEEWAAWHAAHCHD